MALNVTDYVTFARVTDVVVDKDYQGIGLEDWLIEFCNEMIEGVPALRSVVLLARGSASGSMFRLYREMGMEPLEQAENGTVRDAANELFIVSMVETKLRGDE